MSVLSIAESRILIALTIESFKDSISPADVFEVVKRYNVNCAPAVLQSTIAVLEQDGLVVGLRNGNRYVAASLAPKFLTRVLPKVLNYLGASTFEVHWLKEEILTDADPEIDFPSLNGWKVFYLDKEPKTVTSAQSLTLSPIQITNTFSPINNNHQSSNNKDDASSLPAWLNVWVAIIFGIATIAVALWASGKI